MTTATTPKCWVNPTPPRREESDTPQADDTAETGMAAGIWVTLERP